MSNIKDCVIIGEWRFLMFYDIFTNIIIVIAFLLVFGQVFKYSPFESKQTLRSQILAGIFFGILGTVLMIFTIEIPGKVVIDLRSISFICAGIMGGPLAAAFAAATIALFRIVYFGINAVSSTVLSSALMMGAGTAFVSNIKIPRFGKFTWMFLQTMLINNLTLIYLIRDEAKLLETIECFWIINLFGAVLAWFTCEYVISVNANFKLMSYYKITADNLLDMISTHEPDGKIIFVSPSAFQLLGYTPEELVGRSMYGYIHQEDAGMIKEAYSIFTDKEDKTTQIFRMRHKGGKYIWVETSARAIKHDDGSIKEMICVTRDISKRKEIEQELRVSSARFKAIFDNAGTSISLRDIHGNLIDVNSAYLDMSGYSREEANQLSKIVYTDDYKKVHELFNNFAAGRCSSDTSEVRYINKNQQIMYTVVTSTLIPGTEHTPTSIVRVVNNITEWKKVEEELKKAKNDADKLAATDFLTGILNRRAFGERFSAEFQRAAREKYSISLILADIDHFKDINDTYGHQAGDYVLQKFAKCVTNACRPYDFIGRHGGEEFIICLPNTGYEQGRKMAERIRRVVEGLNTNLLYIKKPIKVTASFGVASSTPDKNESIDMLIAKADDAMYKAKEKGRNRVCIACEYNSE